MKTFEKVSFHGTFRDYQQRILDNADRYLLNGKINIVAAPGSGKTILGLELIRRLNEPTIILSPTTTIKYQWGDRFAKSFLEEGEDVDEYFSYDLHEITLINSITYQALHSAMNKLPVEEEGVVIDYSDIDLFDLVRRFGVKTICVDEAHHLQNKWQQSLERFVEQLGTDVRIIALTATPPYDANESEWQKYEKVCGPIDEEIFVPELVKEGTLCPHQDYVIFNYPTKEERAVFAQYKGKVLSAIDALRQLPLYDHVYQTICDKYREDREMLFEETSGIIALLTLLESVGIEVDANIVKSLTTKKSLPAIKIPVYEKAYQFLLDSEFFLSGEDKEKIIGVLKSFSVLEKGRIVFDLKEKDKHKLISSVGKLRSIVAIAEAESKNLGDELRMLILTDFIKKETVKDLFGEQEPTEIGATTIFESLAKSNPSYKVGVLSGGLIILPLYCKDLLKGRKVRCTRIGNSNFAEFTFVSLSNKEKVDLVSKLFEEGALNIIIGTKALLGEGWDSPCINSVILATFVESFMLSNQMRGRAIRIDKNNPNKVSNIWHLATLEPDYVFEESLLQRLALKRTEDREAIKSYDFETLVRRFDCFVGPNYESGEIESGIDRLTIIRPPFDERGVETINEGMLALASKRDDTKSKWSDSTKKNFKLVEEVEVPKERIIQPFHYVNMTGITFLSLGEIASVVFFSICLRTLASGGAANQGLLLAVVIALGIIGAVLGLLIGKVISKIVSHSSPVKNMAHLAKALLETLQQSNVISNRADLRITGNDLYLGIHLTKGSIYEQNVFNRAVTEMLSPIDDPRYLLILKKREKLDSTQSFSCPSILSQKKAMVELFAENLEGRVGDFGIVYTRNEFGRKTLLKCRKKSFLNENDKLIKKRKKVSSYEVAARWIINDEVKK